MYSHPGKKLLFMGQEFGQFIEWDEKKQLDWFLLDYDAHKNLHAFVKKLNKVYKDTPALWEIDYSWDGFTWLVSDDNQNSVAAFERRDRNGDRIIAICNFTPVTRESYRIGVESKGSLTYILDSESTEFGGTDNIAKKRIYTEKVPMHGKDHSFPVTLPGLSCVYLRYKPYKTKSK